MGESWLRSWVQTKHSKVCTQTDKKNLIWLFTLFVLAESSLAKAKSQSLLEDPHLETTPTDPASSVAKNSNTHDVCSTLGQPHNYCHKLVTLQMFVNELPKTEEPQDLFPKSRTGNIRKHLTLQPQAFSWRNKNEELWAQ